MKKILLTTTALTMLAGAAAAEVNVGATARMGVYNDTAGTVTERRMRVNISASGESDGGLTFGAFTRMQTGNAKDGFLNAAGNGMNGSRVWISNGTATLTVGNASGAVGNTAGMYGVGGCGFSASTSYQQYCANVLGQANLTYAQGSSGGAGPNVVRLDFSMGSANVSLSGGNGNSNEVAVAFSLGAASVGIGYDAGAGAAGGYYLNGTMDAGSATVGVSYARSNAGVTHWMVKGSTAVGNGAVGLFVANDQGMNRWGLNYSQSLGGGASATIAYTNQSVAGGGGQLAGNTITAGVTFGF